MIVMMTRMMTIISRHRCDVRHRWGCRGCRGCYDESHDDRDDDNHHQASLASSLRSASSNSHPLPIAHSQVFGAL